MSAQERAQQSLSQLDKEVRPFHRTWHGAATLRHVDALACLALYDAMLLL
jgi:uncharacterized protein YukE